jgi:hypothetical protein
MRSWIALSALALGACMAETWSPAVADHFEVVAGDGQSGRLNGTLDTAIQVRLVDTRGLPMREQPIRVLPSSPDAAVEIPAGTTGTDGSFMVRWTLGSELGPQSLRLIADGDVSVTITAEATALIVDTIASGFFFACGIDPAGRTWCWGENLYGRLGTDEYPSTGPNLIGGDTLHFVELTAGDAHACGRTSGGDVFCWGADYEGQLGSDEAGTSANGSSIPLLVTGLPPVRTLSSSRNRTCALTTTDELWCWGAGGGIPANALAQDAFPGMQFRSVALGGNHGCGITGAGMTVCWGSNGSGQLGQGAGTASSAVPLPIARAVNATRIESGESGSCAIDDTGRLYCWGYFLGLHSRERDSLGAGYPALMDVTGPVRGVSLGWYCGAVWGAVGGPRFMCTGWTGDLESGGTPFRQVEYGSESLCVLTAEKTVYCKSYSDTGSLPYYDYSASAIPAP